MVSGVYIDSLAIGVFSCSSPMAPAWVVLAQQYAATLGLSFTFLNDPAGGYGQTTHLFAGHSAADRVTILQRLLRARRPVFDLVLSVRGGYGANDLLPLGYGLLSEVGERRVRFIGK